MTLQFLLTAFVVVIAPGTGVIYTLALGLGQGRRASVAAAFGCTFGIVPHLLAAIFGLAAILHTSAILFTAVKFAGVGYLLYLAWQAVRSDGALAIQPNRSRDADWRIARQGALINILNPKLSIFFLAFLPLFVSTDAASPTLQMFFLSAVFMAMTLFIFILYGICAHGVRSYVVKSPRRILWLQRTFAVTFAALGAKLAMAEQ